MALKSILEAPIAPGERVLVRVDWNVPLNGEKISEEFRIKNSLKTIKFLLEEEAKVIIVSHLDSKVSSSLEPVFDELKNIIPLKFSKDVVGDGVKKMINELPGGEALLIENLRLNSGEKDNDLAFAKELSEYGEIFVNEAFSASHREHASIVGIPQILPSYAGIGFNEEIEALSKVFYPKHPFLFILGGAKFDTKLPLLEKFLHIADNVFVGGALAHNFFREKGIEIGKSLVSDGEFNLRGMLDTGKVHLPEDMFVKKDDRIQIKTPEEIEPDDYIVDAGPNTILHLKELVNNSAVILWNGPLGGYENGYKKPTLELAQAIAESGRETILGGADTLAAIKELGLHDKFTFVSTGGGAMLDFLATGTLPGIQALESVS